MRHWLLGSALCPAALLPGGPVRWEAIDARSARAVVSWGVMSASLVAHFAPDGPMTHMQSEADGDLNTPYHGSGEHVARSDYQRVGGQLYPFWRGRVDSIRFD